MGKLILRLADGATRDIQLDCERLTIGRRADNHVCLPYPAVSAEHAAVVTILDDSFLEDLNSTNGTLVNGKAITKHFLRDHDEIDIGRQMFVYFSGTFAAAMVDSALPKPRAQSQPASPHMRPNNAPEDSGLAVVEGTTLSSVVSESVDSANIDTAALFGPATMESPEHLNKNAPASIVANAPMLEVLDGPHAGQRVPIDCDEFVIGRVGTQLAAIRSGPEGHRLVHLEGAAQLSVNGHSLPEGGRPLLPGDQMVIADTRVAFHAAT